MRIFLLILSVFILSVQAFGQGYRKDMDVHIEFPVSGFSMDFHDTTFFMMDYEKDLLYSPWMPMIIYPVGEIPLNETEAKLFIENPEPFLRKISKSGFDSVNVNLKEGIIYIIGHEDCSAEELEELESRNFCELTTLLFCKKVDNRWIAVYLAYPTMLKDEYHTTVLGYLKTLNDE